jgi:chromosomal replication initiator protein
MHSYTRAALVVIYGRMQHDGWRLTGEPAREGSMAKTAGDGVGKPVSGRILSGRKGGRRRGSGGDGKSGRCQTGAARQDVAVEIRAAFRDQIGADRFDLWFGAGLDLDIGDAGRSVTVRTGTVFTHDWLKRTFQGDLEAAIRSVCGPTTQIAWLASASDAAAEPRIVPVRAVSARTPTESSPSTPGKTIACAPEGTDTACLRRSPTRLTEFVSGTSNRMAVAAIQRISARPGEMSPLVIHGPSGVGKTHLLEAVCSRARELHPGITVVSLSAEQFTTSFTQSLHGGGLPGFRRSCRSADLFVIDDIQFLAGKRATTLEFQHTVDALHRQGRQMVFACDRELDALGGLGGDVLTRLRGGMTARIEPPDYDVRRGIVTQLCGRRGLVVPEDVVHYVATHITRHARELYGAVNRLEATSLMLDVPISADMAAEALADLVRSSGRSVRLADIEQAVCKAFGIEAGTLQSARRARSASHPRMLAMFLARKHTHAALADIGRYFGRRSHSTVIAAQKAVGDWVANRANVVLAESQWDVEEAIRRVEDMLRAG